MKVNSKTTNEENAMATTTCHKRGQRTVNGIIGNTKRGIRVDQTLDPDSNNPVANKPVSAALAALAGKIDTSLQKPTGLTKTKLVGVGASGQENIEIGENLTLKDGKLAAAGGGSSIPVVEGTPAELSTEEQAMGYSGKFTIPTAQTSSFILHNDDTEFNIFVNVISGRYASIIAVGNDWGVLFGSDTVIYIKPDTPGDIYSTSIEGYLPTDETTSVDITFPAFDRIRNSICVVQDRDNTKVFLKNRDSHNLGRFQTPIICKDDGTYRCWYITEKEGDDTGTLATVKCKIINMGGSGDNSINSIKTLDIEFKFNGTITLTQEQLSLINSYDHQYVYVKFNEGIIGDNVHLGYVIKRQDLGTAISIVSQPNISGNIIVQSAIRIIGTTAGHEEITVPFSTTNSEKFLKTNSEGKPEWASISIPTITFED